MIGYVNAVHVFGRSYLGRIGSSYHLQYQWRKNSDPFRTREITKEQYKEIKLLLGPETDRIESDHSIKIYHSTNALIYMRIKRYLIKNNIVSAKIHT